MFAGICIHRLGPGTSETKTRGLIIIIIFNQNFYLLCPIHNYSGVCICNQTAIIIIILYVFYWDICKYL